MLDLLQVNAGYLRLIQTFVIVFLISHIMGCLWFVMSDLQDYEPVNWIISFGV